MTNKYASPTTPFEVRERLRAEDRFYAEHDGSALRRLVAGSTMLLSVLGVLYAIRLVA